MKSKISPTSPKVNVKHQLELEKLYKDNLKIIEKPKERSVFGAIGFLLLVVILGFFAGILSQLVILSYGSDLPFLGKLSVLLSDQQPSFFIASRSKSQTASAEQIESIISEIAPSVVQIYEKNIDNIGLDSVYSPSEEKGDGFILTEDGYIITKSKVVSDDNDLVVVVDNNKIFNVDSVLSDPVAGFSLLKIDATNLNTLALVEPDSLFYTEDVLLVNKYAVGREPVVIKTSIISSAYYNIGQVSDYVKSSEQYYNHVWLDNKIPSSFDNSVAFTMDQKVIGLVKKEGDQFFVIPFDRINSVIDRILTDKSLKRPYLGIHFLDLSEVVNLPSSLSQGNKQGALIYSDDTTERMGVIENSPAQKAGLAEDDIILKINNTKLDNDNKLNKIILGSEVNKIITLGILRNDVEQDIMVTLEILE